MIKDLTFKDFEPKDFGAARQAFQAKTPLPASVFGQLETEAKSAAFSIARVEAMKDIMAARKVIADAIDGKVTFREALLALQNKLAKGDFSRGTLNRLAGVIRQNVAQAQAIGRKAALTDASVIKTFPYLQYKTVGSGDLGGYGVRDSHARLHGQVFRWDDPFWEAHTPPWDYGYRCYVVPLRQEDVDKLGLKVQSLGLVRKQLDVQPHPDFSAQKGINTLSTADRQAIERLDDDLGKRLEQTETGPRTGV